MKELIFNQDNLSDMDINDIVIRVKVLMLNSNNELLLGYCDGIYQFPGGHVEEGESVKQAVKREIMEETGIDLQVENLEPFYCIKHYTKNYNDTEFNRLSKLYYFFIKTDEKINLENIKYTDHEKSGGYTLKYIAIEDIKNVLNDNIPNNIHNKTIVKEMLTVLDASGVYNNLENLTIHNLKEKQEFIEEVAIHTEIEWGEEFTTPERFDERVNQKIEKIKRRLEDDNYCFLVLLKDEKLVGFISMFPYDGEERRDLTPWYATIYVKEEHRGKGYSKVLNDAILEEAKKRGHKKIYLKTDLEDYYEKFGAKYIEDLKCGKKLYYIDL